MLFALATSGWSGTGPAPINNNGSAGRTSCNGATCGGATEKRWTNGEASVSSDGGVSSTSQSYSLGTLRLGLRARKTEQFEDRTVLNRLGPGQCNPGSVEATEQDDRRITLAYRDVIQIDGGVSTL